MSIDGHDPQSLSGPDLVHHIGLVPQEPGDLLEANTVFEECTASDRDAGAPAGTTRAIVALLAPEILDTTHPRDLSEGQRLLLALAIVLATHDVELTAELATRVVILADGEIVADGSTVDITTSSPMFAPQVAKVLAPARWLTVDQVRTALGTHAREDSA